MKKFIVAIAGALTQEERRSVANQILSIPASKRVLMPNVDAIFNQFGTPDDAIPAIARTIITDGVLALSKKTAGSLQGDVYQAVATGEPVPLHAEVGKKLPDGLVPIHLTVFSPSPDQAKELKLRLERLGDRVEESRGRQDSKKLSAKKVEAIQSHIGDILFTGEDDYPEGDVTFSLVGDGEIYDLDNVTEGGLRDQLAKFKNRERTKRASKQKVKSLVTDPGKTQRNAAASTSATAAPDVARTASSIGAAAATASPLESSQAARRLKDAPSLSEVADADAHRAVAKQGSATAALDEVERVVSSTKDTISSMIPDQDAVSQLERNYYRLHLAHEILSAPSDVVDALKDNPLDFDSYQDFISSILPHVALASDSVTSGFLKGITDKSKDFLSQVSARMSFMGDVFVGDDSDAVLDFPEGDVLLEEVDDFSAPPMEGNVASGLGQLANKAFHGGTNMIESLLEGVLGRDVSEGTAKKTLIGLLGGITGYGLVKALRVPLGLYALGKGLDRDGDSSTSGWLGDYSESLDPHLGSMQIEISPEALLVAKKQGDLMESYRDDAMLLAGDVPDYSNTSSPLAVSPIYLDKYGNILMRTPQNPGEGFVGMALSAILPLAKKLIKKHGPKILHALIEKLGMKKEFGASSDDQAGGESSDLGGQTPTNPVPGYGPYNGNPGMISQPSYPSSVPPWQAQSLHSYGMPMQMQNPYLSAYPAQPGYPGFGDVPGEGFIPALITGLVALSPQIIKWGARLVSLGRKAAPAVASRLGGATATAAVGGATTVLGRLMSSRLVKITGWMLFFSAFANSDNREASRNLKAFAKSRGIPWRVAKKEIEDFSLYVRTKTKITADDLSAALSRASNPALGPTSDVETSQLVAAYVAMRAWAETHPESRVISSIVNEAATVPGLEDDFDAFVIQAAEDMDQTIVNDDSDKPSLALAPTDDVITTTPLSTSDDSDSSALSSDSYSKVGWPILMFITGMLASNLMSRRQKANSEGAPVPSSNGKYAVTVPFLGEGDVMRKGAVVSYDPYSGCARLQTSTGEVVFAQTTPPALT